MAANDIIVPRENAQGQFEELVLPDATTSARGLLSSSDKTKLNGIATGATANTASTATPSALGVAAAGTATAYAREDHVHAMPSAGDVGAAPATGIDPTAITGTAVVDNDARLSDTRDPNTHAASHAAAGSDPVFDQDLNTTDSPDFVELFVGGGGEGFTIASSGLEHTFGFAIDAEADGIVSGSGNLTVEGDLTINNGALDFSGTDPTADKATSRTNLGLGDAATADIGTGAGDVCAGDDARLSDARTPTSHTHGNLTNDGKVGSTSGLPLVTTTDGAVTTLALGTAGQVLQVNSGANGVEFAAASGGDTVSIEASAADVLSVSSGAISADDAGADRIVFWDDSASKLAYLEAGSGLTISGTVMTASGGASINQAIAVGFVLN